MAPQQPARVATIRLAARADAAARLGGPLARACRQLGLPGATRADLALLLDELVTNIVRHARVDPAGKAIAIRLARGRAILGVEITDPGIAFDPLAHPPHDLTAPIETRAVGGVGIPLLIRKSARRCYRREAGRNRLRFALRLPPA